MGKNEKIEELISYILDSNSIDEKRKLGKQVIELFKNSNDDIPIAIQLNLSLRLKDIIDNFITQDNSTSRETLKSFFSTTNVSCL